MARNEEAPTYGEDSPNTGRPGAAHPAGCIAGHGLVGLHASHTANEGSSGMGLAKSE